MDGSLTSAVELTRDTLPPGKIPRSERASIVTKSKLLCSASIGWSVFMDHDAMSLSARNGWQQFLEQRQWDHATTLTLRYPRSRATLVHEFVDRFYRRVAWKAQGKIGAFYVIEEGTAGYPHVHALFVGTAHLTNHEVQSSWKAGLSRILRVRSPSKVIRYILKHLQENPDHYDLIGTLVLLSAEQVTTPAPQILRVPSIILARD